MPPSPSCLSPSGKGKHSVGTSMTYFCSM
jgi:hypothetical protein